MSDAPRENIWIEYLDNGDIDTYSKERKGAIKYTRVDPAPPSAEEELAAFDGVLDKSHFFKDDPVGRWHPESTNPLTQVYGQDDSEHIRKLRAAVEELEVENTDLLDLVNKSNVLLAKAEVEIARLKELTDLKAINYKEGFRGGFIYGKTKRLGKRKTLKALRRRLCLTLETCPSIEDRGIHSTIDVIGEMLGEVRG